MAATVITVAIVVIVGCGGSVWLYNVHIYHSLFELRLNSIESQAFLCSNFNFSYKNISF